MKKSLLFLLLGALFFVSCDKEETTIMEDSSSFSIDGYVLNADGNVPMEGVVVKGAFGETKTDAKGYFNVGGLNHGQYSLIFSADGFGQKIINYDLEVATDTPLEVNYTVSGKVKLFKMDQSITTTIWKVDNNIRSAFANVPYTITLSDEYLNNKIEGTTDANGQVVLNDTLPNDYVTLKMESVDATAGKVYKLNVDFKSSSVAKSYTVSEEPLSEDLYLLTSNIFDTEGKEVNNFVVNNSITFKFNKTLDKDTKAILTNVTDGKEVAVKFSVSGDVLTIDPIEGDLTKNNRYKVEFEAESGNFSLNKSFTFYTEGSLVTNLDKVGLIGLQEGEVVLINSTTVNIQFGKIINAASYEVFYKYGSQSEYRKYEYDLSISSNTVQKSTLYLNSMLDSSDNIPNAGIFDGKSLFIIIRAKNGSVYGDFSDAFEIKKS